jgi:hypothetical protein
VKKTFIVDSSVFNVFNCSQLGETNISMLTIGHDAQRRRRERANSSRVKNKIF